MGPGQGGGRVGVLAQGVVALGRVADPVPDLFGQHQPVIGEPLHAAHIGLADGGDVGGGRSAVQADAGQLIVAALAGEEGPDPTPLPRAHLPADAVVGARDMILAIAVDAVAAPARRLVALRPEVVADPVQVLQALIVIDGQGSEDVRIVGLAHPVADQFQEAAVHDPVLLGRDLAVGGADRGLVVRVLVPSDADEIAAVAEVAAGREHPLFDLGGVAVGGELIAGRSRRIARGARHFGRDRQPGHHGGGGGGGIALLLLPALLLGEGRLDLGVVPQKADLAAVHQEVGRRFQHRTIVVGHLGVGQPAQLPQTIAQHDRHGRLVQLDRDPFQFSVHMGLLQEPAADAGIAGRVRADLDLGQIVEGRQRRLPVAQRRQGHGYLIEVARPDGLVACRRFRCVHRVAPGVGQGGDQGAGMGAVLLHLQHQGRGVGQLAAVRRLFGDARQFGQGGDIVLPADAITLAVEPGQNLV